MKIFRALTIGILIWFLGVATFVTAFFLPILENRELQSNVALVIAIVPIVWFASYAYYKSASKTNGLIIGTIFFAISGALDALITVPVLLAPYGATHAEFFTDPGFWGIGLIFIAVTTFFYYKKVHTKPQTQNL